MRCNHSISKSISLLSNRRQRVSALRWSTTMTDMATFCRSSCRCGVDTRRPTRDTSANWLQSFHISFCSVVEMGATQSIARTEGPTTAGAAATNAAAAGQEASASEPYAPAPMPRLKRAETFEEKLYRKVRIHVGCASMELELCHLSLCPFRSLVPYFPTHQPMSFVRQLNQHSFRRSRSYR